MTSSQFDTLNIHDREAMACLEGVLIGVRQEPEFIIRLYQLDGFYAELYYHQVKDHAVCVKSFEAVARLEPYLNAIDISALLK